MSHDECEITQRIPPECDAARDHQFRPRKSGNHRVRSLVISNLIAVHEKAGDGIVNNGVEAAIRNVARLVKDGMAETDKEIVRIMLSK